MAFIVTRTQLGDLLAANGEGVRSHLKIAFAWPYPAWKFGRGGLRRSRQA